MSHLPSANLFRNVRLIDHLEALEKYSIPTKHIQRYVDDVMLKTYEAAEDDDVKHLVQWRRRRGKRKENHVLTF